MTAEDFTPNQALKLIVEYDPVGKWTVQFTGLWMPKRVHEAQRFVSKQYSFERRQIAKNFSQSKQQMRDKEQNLVQRERELNRAMETSQVVTPLDVMNVIASEQASLLNTRLGVSKDGTERRSGQRPRADSSREGIRSSTQRDEFEDGSVQSGSDESRRTESPADAEGRTESRSDSTGTTGGASGHSGVDAAGDGSAAGIGGSTDKSDTTGDAETSGSTGEGTSTVIAETVARGNRPAAKPKASRSGTVSTTKSRK